jgi:hypothetical protein
MSPKKGKSKKFKARKVYTPGAGNNSKSGRRGRGRPRKDTEKTPERGRYKASYNKDSLKAACEEVKGGNMSERAAAKAYGVPRSTLKDKIAERYAHETAGRPPVLGKEEEELIVERLIMHGNWGFPLSAGDLRHTIRDYLHSQGRKTRFVDNMPGPDFIAGFLQRHPVLSQRKANLIKRSRAGVTHEIVNDFFEKFAITAQGVPPQNVFNYDETYLQENPGSIKAIFKRGIKHAEHVKNHSKTSISVMMCGSASGKLLHPYVVYKGTNVYREWCTAYKDAVFSATKSGWQKITSHF